MGACLQAAAPADIVCGVDVAFVRLAWFPGAEEQHFEALAEAMGDVAPPSGRILFAAGPADGGWQVVQVWESQDELDEFNAHHLFPALARLGGFTFPASPTVLDFEARTLDVRASPTSLDP